MKKEANVSQRRSEDTNRLLEKGTAINTIFERVAEKSHEISTAAEIADNADLPLDQNHNKQSISISARNVTRLEGTVHIDGPDTAMKRGDDTSLTTTDDSTHRRVRPMKGEIPLQSNVSATQDSSEESAERAQHDNSKEDIWCLDPETNQTAASINHQEPKKEESEYNKRGIYVRTLEDSETIKSTDTFVNTRKKKNGKSRRWIKRLRYKDTLKELQVELVKLQSSVIKNNEKLLIIVEGPDLAGKFEVIRRFSRHLDPRSTRTISLPDRTGREKEDWYFQRYMPHLPGLGEIVFFNRSWYDRGVREPINGQCTDQQYGQFLSQAPEIESMLVEQGIKIVKFWLAVSQKETKKRFKRQAKDPVKKWRRPSLDKSIRERWANCAQYRDLMFSWTDKDSCPWIIIDADKSKKAALESIRYVLSTFHYEGKEDAKISLVPDTEIVRRFHRSMIISA